MKFVKSTYKILAYKVLNRDFDEVWVDWALEMLLNGFETEHLIILAGITKPYSQFEMPDLTTRTLRELELEYSDIDKTIKNYVFYIVDSTLNGELLISSSLKTLSELYFEYGMSPYLTDFWLLNDAKEDLQESEHQWYWPDANRNNIDNIIHKRFEKWKAENNYHE